MTDRSDSEQQDRIAAAFDLVGRTGATWCQMRYSEGEAPGEPVVWVAVGEWAGKHEAGAGLTPAAAAQRLLDQVVDGAMCTHCRRPSGVTEQLDDMPMSELVCWYQYDPELKVYRRGCEGR